MGHHEVENPGFSCLTLSILVHDKEKGDCCHQFPEDKKREGIFRGDDKCHREHKKADAAAEQVPAVPAFHMLNISHRVDGNTRGDTADQEQEKCGEAVDKKLY